MSSPRALSRVREQIHALGGRSLDTATLRGHVLDVLRETIRFDAYVWLLTDPVTTVGAAPLADVPPALLAQLPALVRARYTTAQNRWTVLLHRPVPVALLARTPPTDQGELGSWRALVGRHGISDVATTVFADRYGCWGFLDLWRCDPSRPFAAGVVDLLADIAPVVTTALRQCQARTFVEAATSHRHDRGPVVLTLDDDLRILARTAASQDWLDVLLPPGPGAAAVPASVYNVAAQLLAVEAGVDTHPASARTHLADGFWLTLRAARMAGDDRSDSFDGKGGSDGKGGIVVSIEETSADERLDLFARASGLSARERELLADLATGADTRAMARTMALSELTVQDHLKSIFAKTGARDRVALLSRALGTRPPP